MSDDPEMIAEMARIRKRVLEYPAFVEGLGLGLDEVTFWGSTPQPLRPLHRMLRALAGSCTNQPVTYQRGCAEPHLEGRRGYSPSGRIWRTSRERPLYRPSTLCVAVGIDWPGLRAPDPSLAWRTDEPVLALLRAVRQSPALPLLECLIVIRQSVPEPVTLMEVAGAWNEEYRSWLMNRCSEDEDAYVIDRDDYGTLIEIPAAREHIRAVKVTCPTTGRRYLLRVPPTVTTAHEAVAWTFRLAADEYRPTVQS